MFYKNIVPFLFFLVVELLFLYILNSTTIEGIHVFHRELKITQLSDDTALFLKDSKQVNAAISLVEDFSLASGLKLNKLKCEILCLYNTDASSICNISVKKCQVSHIYICMYEPRGLTTTKNFGLKIK